jgi:hypothetical protein
VLTRAGGFDAIKRGQLNDEGVYKSAIEKIEYYGSVAVTMSDDAVATLVRHWFIYDWIR